MNWDFCCAGRNAHASNVVLEQLCTKLMSGDIAEDVTSEGFCVGHLSVTQLHTIRQVYQEGKAARRAPPEGLFHNRPDAGTLPWCSPQHGLNQPLSLWQMPYSLQIGTCLLVTCSRFQSVISTEGKFSRRLAFDLFHMWYRI